MNTVTPNPITHICAEAAGNFGFLLSVIRRGETLSEAEEQNIRRIMEHLNKEAKQDNANLFSLGKQARLTGGGPWMTISKVQEEIYCIWFIEGIVHSGYFPRECLVFKL